MRAIRAIERQIKKRTDLDDITMLDWLQEQRQPPRAIERFWRQILVSAINEELDKMAARHGFQVFQLGFLARRNSYEMGVPAVPLAQLYRAEAGQLAVGQPADLCLFDPHAMVRISADTLKSQGRNTPYLGIELPGRVRCTLVGGRVVYEG